MKNNHLQWIAFLTIFRRDFLQYIRSWPQSVLPSIITSILYFLIFGQVMGTRIGPMAGFSYIQYITPGLILLAVINNSYINSASHFYLLRFTRAVEELLAAPVKNSTLLLGIVSSSMIRGMAVGIVVSIIALAFTHLNVQHSWVMIIVVVLTTMLFSLAGFINGIYAKSFDGIAFVPTFLLTPLTYLGGVFYSVTLLPPFWRQVSLFNPILYMVDGFRYGLLGTQDISFVLACLILSVFIVFLWCWALILLKRGIGIKT